MGALRPKVVRTDPAADANKAAQEAAIAANADAAARKQRKGRDAVGTALGSVMQQTTALSAAKTKLGQ